MTKLKKAKDLYLRGFSSEYIFRRTGIRIQKLLSELKKLGEKKYIHADILEYQINYITNKYSIDDIKNGYRIMSEKYPDLSLAKRNKSIYILGCCFGDYSKVFSRILGDDEYKNLRNECWKKKQVKSVKDRYGVENVFDKSVFSNFVSDEAIANGRVKRNETMIQRYGVSEPLQNADIKKQMMENRDKTMMSIYGTTNAMQVKDVAMRSAVSRQANMLKKYGYKNSVESPDIRLKIFEARRKNNTLTSSFLEDAMYSKLVDIFGKDDVDRNIIVDNRYPYAVDFYIKSRDLFIELNAYNGHNDHWFNPDSKRDQQIVRSYVENGLRVESETGRKSKYFGWIRTWTDKDVKKRNSARDNKLNYLVFWDGSFKTVNKKRIPNFVDFYKWIDAGCPDSCDFDKNNTY